MTLENTKEEGEMELEEGKEKFIMEIRTKNIKNEGRSVGKI